jgi:outer membrane protein assembly factor BamE (lipoprotein component of BamABCDE complex)
MKKIATLCVLFLLSACAGTPINWDNARLLKVGMTENEVTSQMGKPYMVSSRSDGTQIWVYTFVAGLGGSETLSLTMKDGKAIQVPIVPASFH